MMAVPEACLSPTLRPSSARTGPPAETRPRPTATTAKDVSATSKPLRSRRETATRRETARAAHAAPTDAAIATQTTAATRCPSRSAATAGAFSVVSASKRDAYAMHRADGSVTTVDVQSSRSRRGSVASATTKPIAIAPHAPREKVKYSVVYMIGRAAAAGSASDERRACATKPSVTRAPIDVSSPSEFQYPSGSASRYDSLGSWYVSKRSGKSRVASAYAEISVTPTAIPARTPGPSPRRRTKATASASAMYTSIRSPSRTDAAELIDQIAESMIQTPSRAIRDANATRSRPGASTRSRMSKTVVGTRNASATQPHDCEK